MSADGAVAEPPSAVKTSERASRDAKIRNCRILMVDDRIANVSLLENVLTRLGYKNVKGVTDPRVVFTIVTEWEPDLIVLDLAMPHINGFQVMNRLRLGVPKEEWIPVLVLTADTDAGTKRKALTAGATEFLPKPFDSSEILLRIHNLLLMRILQRELQAQNEALDLKVSERTEQLVTRSKELERALKELKDAQDQLLKQERFRAFGEMAGGVVHDFNNVLMCVVGYTDLLLQNPQMWRETETVTKFLETMNTAGHDAAHVVRRLRNFYRPREESDIFTPVDLKQLLEEAISLTQPKWKAQALAAGAAISIRLDLQKTTFIACNAAEIREVAVNLIFNAVDAMPNGGTLTLRTRQVDQDVLIEVIDTGLGMTEEVRQRCIEPFFSTKGEQGTGLGLSMVFGIIKRHEGKLDIETVLGVGTTFRITLPAQLEAEDDDGFCDAIPCRPLRILAVDDEPVARDVVARYLTSDGHAVSTATNSEEAIDQLERQEFDLIITDQAMPGMSGEQLAIHAKARRPTQPVILLTGFSDLNVSDDATSRQHFDRVLRKPVSHAALRSAVAEVAA